MFSFPDTLIELLDQEHFFFLNLVSGQFSAVDRSLLLSLYSHGTVGRS